MFGKLYKSSQDWERLNKIIQNSFDSLETNDVENNTKLQYVRFHIGNDVNVLCAIYGNFCANLTLQNR